MSSSYSQYEFVRACQSKQVSDTDLNSFRNA